MFSLAQFKQTKAGLFETYYVTGIYRHAYSIVDYLSYGLPQGFLMWEKVSINVF